MEIYKYEIWHLLFFIIILIIFFTVISSEVHDIDFSVPIHAYNFRVKFYQSNMSSKSSNN